jgi:HK97 gp10 family phage protein
VAERARIEGLAELEKALKEMPDKIARKAMRMALKEGAGVLQREMEARAPRGAEPLKEKRTRLAESFKTAVSFLGASRGENFVEAKIRVKRSAFHWIFIEFGTSRMPARPFIRPVIDGKWQDALGRMRDVLKREIEKFNRRGT